jgi:hypothetical protein
VRRDLGDFQTPPELVAEVLDALGPIGARWPRVLEPTCGRGHFVSGLLASSAPPREIQAVEIQDAHYHAAQAIATAEFANGVHVRITQADLFDMHLSRDLDWREQGPLLVIGNPPWVTNAELGTLEGALRPPRRNLKGLRGLEARTGSSNFDVTEAIWLKLAFELVDQQPTIALLCKTSVARSILQFAHRASLTIESASIRRIDASRWFGATVDACLFCATLGNQQTFPSLVKRGRAGLSLARPSATPRASFPPLVKGGPGGVSDTPLRIPIYPTLSAPLPTTVMAVAHRGLIADIGTYDRWSFADGLCPLDWRQGLKHDAAAVMELLRDPASDRWRNRGGEVVDVEPEFIYPLVKGTDLTRLSSARPERATLVTQARLGEATEPLAKQAPRLWRYLTSHASDFAQRKSSIYRGQPPFSLFGIGPYSFAPFKVAISGMHKEPRFRALPPVQGRPVMLDDTCYFLPCPTAEEASILTALCNDRITQGLIGSLIFCDNKRPITKKLLQRVNLLAVLQQTARDSLLARATEVLNDELGTPPRERIADVISNLERRFSQPES